MTDGLRAFSEWKLAEHLGLVLLLLALFGLLRRLALKLARRPGPLGRLHRLLPLVEGAGTLLLLAAVTRNLLAGRPQALLAAGAILLAGSLWAARGWLHDLFSGWALRLEEPWSPGRRVRVEGAEGEITRLGLRSLTLDAADGRRVWLPWSRLAGQGVELLGGGAGRGGAACRLTLTRREGDPAAQRALLERRLLLDPRVLPTSPVWITSEVPGEIELRVQLLDAGQAADLELELRRAVAGAEEE